MVSLDSTGEMGGKGVDLTQPVDDGSLVGSTIYGAGSAPGPTARHSDIL